MRIAAQGINLYTENAQRAAVRPDVEVESVQARVKTRSFGFNLGKLGVNFTAKDLEFEPSEAEVAAQEFRSKSYPRTQSEERDVQDVANYLAQTQCALSGESATYCPENSGYRLSRAISAYSQQSGVLNHSLPGRALGKV
ncbi:hypothetical protein SAMN05660337_0840 [Maridesulfovibrio ferrireducens]|uniref:Uncharacterized protein n=1 Tax=Maridesulfovibrio ferrireducens TaxID=246191 RepID=A0A1G9CYJ5_9BACT|nr:hypothetical protein [Maridesulfovibrio ferrireducens]SDK56693.1 hypothetical protein SAMN05660337_0840 [Maridesulfovibrio ferrireducens]